MSPEAGVKTSTSPYARRHRDLRSQRSLIPTSQKVIGCGSWQTDKLRQQAVVQLVQDNADPALLEAAWHARARDLEPAKAAYNALFEQLKRNSGEAADLAERMANTDLGKLWSCRGLERQRGMGYSPNLTAFNWMLQGQGGFDPDHATSRTAFRCLAA